MALILLAVSAALTVYYLIAKKFADIAASKGYSETKYFWICILLGIIGYIWVIALPKIYPKSRNKQ